MKRFACTLTFVLFAYGALAQAPDDAAIRKILADRIDRQHASVGIVAGVIDANGRRVVSHGALAKGDKRTLDGDTVFEIGSATKVFTALLLADMVARGEVALTDPVAKYLPAEVKVPERGGKKITLEHLATHTSALPRLPANLAPKDPTNPYADYTVVQLYDFLSKETLTRDIGAQYEYSNLGVGLLGHVLALRAGMDYETLVRKRILEPLGMKSTSIALSKAMQERLAAGHDAGLDPAANWDVPTLAGAGALRSTVNDLLTFLAAQLGYTKSPLAAPMAAMLAARRATGGEGTEIALGWHISRVQGTEVVWHNGGTGGYRSFVGFDPKSRTGVVVLSNTSTNAGIDDIGRHLLVAASPLLQPAKERKVAAVDPKLYDRYVGRYEIAPNFILTVTRDETRLYTQATGQPKFEIFPESDKKFFLKVVDAQLTFETGAEGPATQVILHQNGANTPAKRIGDAPPPAPAPKEVTVDPKLFDGYLGRYQLAPAFVLTVTREGDQLFVQATGQPKFQVFPKGDREFFYKVVEAAITFVVDESGRATSLVLHQNGMDMPAKRVE
ncbi:MAG TPA: serine hydrolase [Thermoanaerobaculia bacterium]|nr:serine hydrolase [Thermoanaerobaculia bacterium]